MVLSSMDLTSLVTHGRINIKINLSFVISDQSFDNHHLHLHL